MTQVDPASAPNDLDTPIVITGTGFTAGMTVTLGNTQLPDATWVSSTTLTATVPWGLNPGVYTLTVAQSRWAIGQPAECLYGDGRHRRVERWQPVRRASVSDCRQPYHPDDALRTPLASGDIPQSRRRRDLVVEVFRLVCKRPRARSYSPNRLYIYSSGVGASLQRSDDEGDTWVRLTTSFPVTQTLGCDCEPSYRPYAHPTASGTAYVAACGGSDEVPSGLIKSLDYGQTFTPAVNGLTDTQVTALAFHPTDPMTMYVGTANGNLFYSHNGGDTWHYASKPVGYVGTLAVNPFGAHEVWVSVYSQQGDPCAILKSANADLTDWTAIVPDPEQSQCATAIQFAPTTSGTIALAADALWKSIDGGDTWSNVWPTETYGEIVNHAAFHPTDSNSLYAATMRTGIQKSVNGGITWTVANQGLAAAFPDQMTVVSDQPGTVYAKFASWQGVFKTTRGGQSWQFLPTPNGTPSSVLADPFQPLRVYVGTGRNGRIYISDDGGQTWPVYGVITPPTKYAGCFMSPEVLRADPAHPGTLLCGVGYTCGGNWSSSTGQHFPQHRLWR